MVIVVLPYELEIPYIGISLEELKTHAQTNVCSCAGRHYSL